MKRNRRRSKGSEGHRLPTLLILTFSVALACADAGASEPLPTAGPAGQSPALNDSLASTADSLANPLRRRRLPLAPSAGYVRPQFHPSVDCGIGLRSFAPDLSGLAPLFGHTPPLGLSPITSVSVEFNLSDLIGIQADGGWFGGGSDTDGKQGQLGLAVYPRVFGTSMVRPSIGAGRSFCDLHTWYSGFRIEGGTKGWYAMVGLEYRTPGPVIEVYACRTFMERIATTADSDNAEERIRVSIDLSSVMFGVRLQI